MLSVLTEKVVDFTKPQDNYTFMKMSNLCNLPDYILLLGISYLIFVGRGGSIFA